MQISITKGFQMEQFLFLIPLVALLGEKFQDMRSPRGLRLYRKRLRAPSSRLSSGVTLYQGPSLVCGFRLSFLPILARIFRLLILISKF